MAKLTIDGKEIEVPDGTSLFDACRDARGEALPHFCYHPDLSIAGVCRLCQVEVEGMPKLTIACNTTVRDGMVVHTRNERVTSASTQILEMHLINHPVDCPICDQAGECGLQNQYMNHGLYEAKVEMDDKVTKAKAQVIGPHVILDKERCVLCSRCVRFCDEVTGTGEMGIFNRGDRAEIGTAPGVELDNNYSLNTVDLCPVGALTSRDFRFQKRVWMLKATSSVCPGCATGCNVRIDHEAGRIFRLKPRYNPEVNGRWMCDKGRMVYKAVHDEGRLGDPMVAGDAGAWSAVPGAVADLGAKDGFGLAITGPHQSLEEMHLLKVLAGDAPVHGGLTGTDRDEKDNLLLDADRTPNRKGLALLGIEQSDGSALAGAIKGASGPILIHGGDPAADPAVAEALSGKNTIYIGTRGNATSALATVVLPAAMWAEKDGIFVNRDGRLQRFAQGVARHGNAREDWRILAELMNVRGLAGAPGSLKGLRSGLNAAAGLDADLNKLPERGFVPGGDVR
ncbi:MAG: 2Fe-2S iron-sulfur cluster-binding protein [Candidatus Krumholzibacteriota bacterium]